LSIIAHESKNRNLQQYRNAAKKKLLLGAALAISWPKLFFSPHKKKDSAPVGRVFF